MATEKQIAANRANAQKSTGPKTAAGRARSSRNAFLHGLSLPLQPDKEASAKASAIARALIRDETTKDRLIAAAAVAQAQLELLRIGKVRDQLMVMIDLQSAKFEHLQRLAALDRYERRAHTKRRLALRKL